MEHSGLREREVRVYGVRSVVREGGPEAPEAVVFVHGNPGSSRDWIDLATGATAFARVVAPDMPGFGHADKPADFEYTVAGYARHLGGLLDGAGIQRAHLVLHDFGGPWGLAWAAAHPDAYASVSLIDTGVLPGYHWHIWARIWRTPWIGEAFQQITTRVTFRSLLKLQNPRLPLTFIDEMYDDYDEGTRRAVLRLYRATDDLSQLTGGLAEMLRPLGRPALVLWGGKDPYIPARYAERQRESFPGARVTVLDDCAHWPHIEDPGAVRALLLRFLETQVGRH